MIVAELPDGTQLNFPDDMPDDELDSQVASHMARMDMHAAMSKLADAINAQRADYRAGVVQIVEAILRPRVLERDMMGKPVRAKPAPPTEA
jgi:hypothetical protein